MTEPDPEAWKARTSGRERVRMVVETLSEPATVSAIADEADVAWATANSELERLLSENQVEAHDGGSTYAPNPVRLFLDQVVALIDEHDRDELEAQLVDYQSRIESLQAEHDAESAAAFRERLTDESSAADMREIRDVAATWGALETERRLVKRALDFYDDVSRLSGDDHGAVPA